MVSEWEDSAGADIDSSKRQRAESDLTLSESIEEGGEDVSRVHPHRETSSIEEKKSLIPSERVQIFYLGVS